MDPLTVPQLKLAAAPAQNVHNGQLMELYIGIAASIVAAIIALQVFRKWRQAKAGTIELIDSMMTNAEENLGYPPDAASMTYLANHPFLSAKVWEMLGAGGGSLSGYLPEYQADCDRLMQYVRDDSFRKHYPCAHAIFQYAVYLCDATLNRDSRCRHPKDEISSDA